MFNLTNNTFSRFSVSVFIEEPKVVMIWGRALKARSRDTREAGTDKTTAANSAISGSEVTMNPQWRSASISAIGIGTFWRASNRLFIDSFSGTVSVFCRGATSLGNSHVSNQARVVKMYCVPLPGAASLFNSPSAVVVSRALCAASISGCDRGWPQGS